MTTEDTPAIRTESLQELDVKALERISRGPQGRNLRSSALTAQGSRLMGLLAAVMEPTSGKPGGLIP